MTFILWRSYLTNVLIEGKVIRYLPAVFHFYLWTRN